MKPFLTLLAAVAGCGLLAGCQDLTITKGPDNVVTGHLKSFGRKSSVQHIGVNTNGVWTVEGYNSDEVTLPLATIQALIQMAGQAKAAGL